MIQIYRYTGQSSLGLEWAALTEVVSWCMASAPPTCRSTSCSRRLKPRRLHYGLHIANVFLFLITLMCTGVEQLCMKTQHSCPPHLVSVCVVGPPAAAPYLPVLRCRSSTAWPYMGPGADGPTGGRWSCVSCRWVCHAVVQLANAVNDTVSGTWLKNYFPPDTLWTVLSKAYLVTSSAVNAYQHCWPQWESNAADPYE